MIRLAELKDLAGIRECAALAYARYVPLIGRKPAPMVADFECQIASEMIYVAVDEINCLQGFVVFYEVEEGIHLENVAVLPGAAGKGIGRALIRFCESECLKRGFDTVHLYTNERMTENLSIYPRLGYVEVDRRIEDGFSRVYFEKRLSGQEHRLSAEPI